MVGSGGSLGIQFRKGPYPLRYAISDCIFSSFDSSLRKGRLRSDQGWCLKENSYLLLFHHASQPRHNIEPDVQNLTQLMITGRVCRLRHACNMLLACMMLQCVV